MDCCQQSTRSPSLPPTRFVRHEAVNSFENDASSSAASTVSTTVPDCNTMRMRGINGTLPKVKSDLVDMTVNKCTFGRMGAQSQSQFPQLYEYAHACAPFEECNLLKEFPALVSLCLQVMVFTWHINCLHAADFFFSLFYFKGKVGLSETTTLLTK